MGRSLGMYFIVIYALMPQNSAMMMNVIFSKGFYKIVKP